MTVSSNEQLVEFFCNSDEAVVHPLVELLRSRLSPTSCKLREQFSSLEKIPARNTTEQREMVSDLVNLLGWYGSNTVGYVAKKVFWSEVSKQYSRIAMDVAKLIRRRLPKKQRPDLPRAPGVAELETLIAQMLMDVAFDKKSTEDIKQILTEAGLEEDAAKALAKRLIIKFSQRTILKLVSVIGWLFLALDVALFMTFPARRITIKAVPYIALLRVRNQLKHDEES